MKDVSLLVSRKLTMGDHRSEDYLRLMKEQIPTAKVSTDEQEPHKRLPDAGKVTLPVPYRKVGNIPTPTTNSIR